MADFLLDQDEAYCQYKNDEIESQGFYVSNDYGYNVSCGVARIKKDDVLRYKKADHAAEYAVAKFNDGKNNKLVYLGITNLNMKPTAGALYYITLKTKDSCGHIYHYQAKVWEKINTDDCCVMINNLQPWMDENYLFYSCFYRDREGLVDIKVKQESGECIALLCFESAAEEFVKKYNGAPMPYSNQFYNLVLMKH
ncbi:hypothetical protein Leryth_001240 [Lithospermum erythrorhizon]|nr:hypothetical protein Leryth_001240 [Lithospermum erythrorhizon]